MENVDAIDHFQRGIELFREGALEIAFEEFEKAIELDPKVADYYYWAGVVLLSLEKHNDSLNYFKKAIELDPKNAEYHFGLASALLEKDKYEEAIEELKKASSLNPNEGKYHWALSLAYSQLNKKHEALDEINKAIELDPKNHVYLNTKNYLTREMRNKVLSYISSEMYQEVLEELEKEKKVDPNNSFLYYYSALALLKTNRPEKAIKEIEEAIKLEDKSEYHQLASLILDNLSRVDDSIKEIQKAIQLNPYEEINYYTYAFLLFKKGLIKESITQYGRFIEMSSKENLLSEAVKNVEIGVIFYNNPEFYYYLGLGYYKLKKFQQSLEMFKKAYQLSKEDKFLYWIKKAEEKMKTEKR
ncbi:tetratricopeptide repeat protein [Acidianus sulfidivorans]|nr:tetratricopeptide repeat protein [Acidianus sulfidivorans]